MLVLSRRVGERLMIGESIIVTVLGISRLSVRLGIEAPRGVPINREEIERQLRAEGRRDVSDPRRARRLRLFAA